MNFFEQRFKILLLIATLYVGAAVLYTRLTDSERGFPLEAKPEQGALIHNTLVGETIRVLTSEHSENGWTSVIEVTLAPRGSIPFSHVHQSYTEFFTVVEGSLRVDMDGETLRINAGESFTVEPGIAHVPSNPFEEIAVFRVEVRGVPHFTSCLSQIHRRLGDDEASWLMRHLRVGRLANVCDIYVSAIPWWLQAAGMTISAPILELLGFPVYEPMVTVAAEESNNE